MAYSLTLKVTVLPLENNIRFMINITGRLRLTAYETSISSGFYALTDHATFTFT